MERSAPAFSKYLLVCENERQDGRCSCAPAGNQIREKLKQLVADRGLAKKVRVSRTGCLDVCEDGPNVLLMPDNIWFKRVTEADLEGIFKIACGSK